MIKLLLAAAVALKGLTGSPAADAAQWATYTNDRYAFSACYPKGVLSPEREADNGDGRHFRSRDGADLAVYGSQDVEHSGYAGELKYFRSDAEKAGGVITYFAHGKTWGVLSGTMKGRIFYVKAIERGNEVLVFDFEYPTSTTVIYSPLSTEMLKCFRLGQRQRYS